MRKKYFILIIFLMPYSILYPQIKIYTGFKGGLTFPYQKEVFLERSDIRGVFDPEGYSTQTRPGFFAGAFLESSFGKRVSILAEMNFAEKGWKEYGQSYLVNCLSFPLLMHLKIGLGKFTPYFLFGPRLDIILSHDSLSGYYVSMYTANFGVTGGLGCEREINKHYTILAELRYDFDLNHDLIRPSVTEGGMYYYSRALEFLVGVKF